MASWRSEQSRIVKLSFEDQPQLVWDGNYFQFNTLLRLLGGGGGFFTVSGTIAGDGTVRGKMQRLGGRGATPQPAYEYTGRHVSQK